MLCWDASPPAPGPPLASNFLHLPLSRYLLAWSAGQAASACTGYSLRLALAGSKGAVERSLCARAGSERAASAGCMMYKGPLKDTEDTQGTQPAHPDSGSCPPLVGTDCTCTPFLISAC